MSAPPKTELAVLPDEAEAIRHAVRTASLALLGDDCVFAGPEHVDGLVGLLSDPAVSGPIYDLPRQITAKSILAWIHEAQAQRTVGEGILIVNIDASGRVSGYSRFTIWPERSAAEIAGAHRADHQNAGRGKAGAARSFGWMFDVLNVRLIGVTAALDNVRSARVIEAAGFVPMGERETIRPDGTTRRSLSWEMTRDDRRAGGRAPHPEAT